jgi:glutaconate CoA-transferase subunit A
MAPEATVIPSFCVDAVCEVPYGSYPGNMPGEYFSDEDHLRQWLDVEKDEAGYRDFLQKYIYGVDGFEGYLQLCGGLERIKALRAQELLLPGKE